MTPIAIAAHSGSLSIVKYLLEVKGCSLDTVDNVSWQRSYRILS